MEIKTFYAIEFAENSYAAECDDGIFLVDTGEFTPKLEAYVKENASNIKYVLLTHMHFDHIGAVADVKNICPNAKVVIHFLDAEGLFNSQKNLADYFGFETKKAVADITCNDLDVIKMGQTEIKVLHTPGHTAGGVCYLVNEAIFTGDTLFAGSCGRIDFPGGDAIVMQTSLKRLKNLEGDYKIFPGHNNPTTLNEERFFNPYLRSL